MTRFKPLFVICLFILLTLRFPVIAQNNSVLDSLRTQLAHTKKPIDAYPLHLELAKQFWTENKDSAIFHFDKAELLARKAENMDAVFDIIISRTVFLSDNADYDSALEVLFKIKEEVNVNENPLLYAQILSNIGNNYSLKWNQANAIKYYKDAITIIEKENNPKEMSVMLGRLGNVYYMNQGYAEAIDYYNRASTLFRELANSKGVAVATMNIGNCYKQMERADSAITYYTNAYKQFREIGDLIYNEAQCLANIGNLNVLLEKYADAERYLTSADSLFTITQNSFSIAQVSIDLSNLYLELGQLKRVKFYAEKSIEIAKINDFQYLTMSGYMLLWKYYEGMKDIQNTYKYHLLYTGIREAIFYAEKEENADMLLAKFETEQKVKEIELLKQADTINQLEIKRRAMLLNLTLIGLIVAIGFAIFLYFNMRHRKRVNTILTLQNAEINQQKEEITAQRDEIESQRDMVQDQNVTLEEFRDHTTHSLRYAQSIQAAIMPSEKILQQIGSDNFVMMKPCELVSGDFFWAATFNEYQVFCMADCTGHGVPGAFMSILGITALDDIVNRHRVTKPAEILGYLRQSVIETLSQNDPDHLHKDGMDISLCVLNTKTRELQFAGAGLHLWMAVNQNSKLKFQADSKTLSHNDHTLFEIRGDIMPVGQSPLNHPFVNHSISLANNVTSIYLVTDGFVDQLNDSREKYGGKQLKTLILSHCDKPMADQKLIFEHEFENWMGSSYQVDDVTVLGIRLA